MANSMSDLQFNLTAILASITFRIFISIAKHSGQHNPPMFGDYEAQRHWQEITYNLPAIEWYSPNIKSNNLTYWGLDYPPLTAFHSLAIAYLAPKSTESEWLGLGVSQGIGSRNEENQLNHKIFMRGSVLLTDMIIYIPAVLFFSKKISKFSRASTILLLNAPFLLMIDYAHFQYNGVTIGLVVAALAFFLQNNAKLDNNSAICGSTLFMASILYKQMALYYALPIFFFLVAKILNKMLSPNDGKVAAFWLLACLAIGVIVITGLTFLPWLLPQEISLRALEFTKHEIVVERMSEIFTRVFPVGRGIFEDKVASFWCTINNVVKVKDIFTQEQLFRMAMGCTLGISLPICFHLFYVTVFKPSSDSAQMLRYSIINVGLAFFLFSYHVHEKTILLIGIPILLNVGTDLIQFLPFWFSDCAMFSLVPLFYREGNLHFAVGVQLVFVGVRQMLFRMNPSGKKDKLSEILWGLKSLSEIVMILIVCAMVMFPTPSERYPDLMEVMVAGVSSCSFGGFLAVFILLQIEVGNRGLKVGEGKKKN